MATKKSSPKKSGNKKTTMIKIAEKIGQLAGEFSVKKDHLVEMASGAIESARSTIHDITTPKKTAAKKAVKASVKKVVKKAIQPAVKKAKTATPKKAAPVKKAIKKLVKKAPLKKR